MPNIDGREMTDWDDHSRRAIRFYKEFMPSLVGNNSAHNYWLLADLALNPAAVLLRLQEWRHLKVIRAAIAVLIVGGVVASAFSGGGGWDTLLHDLSFLIPVSILMNLVLLFINASLLHLQHDITSSATPSEDMWRQMSSPLNLQTLIANIGKVSESPARRIPLLLLSKRLENGIVETPEQRSLVFADLDSFQYSSLLCDCIDLSWESLHWVVDPEDFRNNILPSFVAEAVVIAGLVEFNGKRAKDLQLRSIERWAHRGSLRDVFRIITGKANAAACEYCPRSDRCDGTDCHLLYLPSHTRAVQQQAHSDLGLLWALLYNYAAGCIGGNLDHPVEHFKEMWESYDGFSITSVLPHAERFRSSATQSKKRFVYLDTTDSLSGDGVLTSMRLSTDSERMAYVNSISPITNDTDYSTEGWVNSSAVHGWDGPTCRCLLRAAFALFEASCGAKSQARFFNKAYCGEDCIKNWRRVIAETRRRTGIEEADLTIDFGVFDQRFCVGSVRRSGSRHMRDVVSLFPCPSDLSLPFTLDDRKTDKHAASNTVEFQEVLRCLK